MSDAHDEAAKALMPDCGCSSAAYYRCTKCDGTGEKRCDRDDLAAALRKAAADERENCAAYVREQAAKVPRDHSTLSDEVREVLRITAEALAYGHRARAKGGA